MSLVALGKYFRNLSRPSGSKTSSRGKLGSLVVVRFITDESIERKFSLGLSRLRSSLKKRGLVLSIESQQGILKATGLFPGIWLSASTQSKKFVSAAWKSP